LKDAHFFDHPWPSDLRLEDGSPRWAGYPNPRSRQLLGQYIDSLRGTLDGFSPVAAGFVRFTRGLDPATLPQTPTEALDPGAAAQLIDIDPASLEHGQRKLVSLHWQGPSGVYWNENTLAFMPTFGFPLRPHTRYAFVVTSAVKAEGGHAVGRSADLDAVLGLASGSEAATLAGQSLSDSIAELEAAGIPRSSVVHLTVFTTADPMKELLLIRDSLSGLVPPPAADPNKWALLQSTADFDEYTGEYGPSPNFQHGTIPFYSNGDGGGFLFENGAPVVADTFTLRFSLAVPNPTRCPEPPSGYPTVLYAHGTGGDYQSDIQDGTAAALAQRCLATLGIDQLFHGTRPGAPAAGNLTLLELLFFNFQNVDAARTNARQSAIDEMQRARLVRESQLSVPASVAVGGQAVHFDPNQALFFGHSQGSLGGALFLAADSGVRGGVLSGASAVLTITLLEKTSPSPSLADLVKEQLLDLSPEESKEVNDFHPALSLLQSVVDVVDPINGARLVITEPRAGFPPKSIYLTEGVNPDGSGDTFAPPHGIEANALALGLPLQLPGQHPLPEGRWGGPAPVLVTAAGLRGNLAGGQASGVLAQWAVPTGEDGHFVVFQVPSARAQAAQFLRNLADDPKGMVPPP
jgi:hypothetical protein